MNKQKGFAFLELVLVAVVVAAVAFAAVTAYNRHQAATGVAADTSATASVPAAPQVTSAPDLSAAETALDSVNVDNNASDSSQLSSQASGF